MDPRIARRYRVLIVAGLAALLPASSVFGQAQPTPPAANAQPNSLVPSNVETNRGFNAVGVDTLDDLRSLVLEGPKDQVDAILKVIEEIDRLSLGNAPKIDIVPLKSADSRAMGTILFRVWEARQFARVGEQPGGGTVAFVPIEKPNAIVVVAPPAELDAAVAFVKELDDQRGKADVPFRIFPLKMATATVIQAKLAQFFAEQEAAGGLRTRVEVIADERTNSLLVFAGPADMAQVETLIQQLDTNKTSAISELKVFPLRNAIATELANLLQQAIANRAATGTTTTTTGVGAVPGVGAAAVPGAQGAATGANAARPASSRSSRLRMQTLDDQLRQVESGIIEDIRIFADDRTNSLIVTSPPDSMGLIALLISQLDVLPSAASELKVFALRSSDALDMLATLQAIFQQTSQTGAGGAIGQAAGALGAGQLTFRLGNSSPELSRVAVNFAADVRTNSIIASGGRNDLIAVEAVILRLDGGQAHDRKTVVYRLRNLTAADASTAINNFLVSQNVLAQAQEGRISFQEQISREVTVVPEPISNSLLISSSPRFYDEILRIVEQIDMRPPQVMIQVLIAEVQLENNLDFGIEAGLQNSALFDRSLTVQNTIVNNGTTQTQAQSLIPGYNFNTTDLLQSPLVGNPATLGAQTLSNFALGRGNNTLGYGGLILALSNENISFLLRALKQQRRLDVLTRPQVVTLDNQQAFIQIGQRVPIVSGSQITPQGGVVNNVSQEDVGILLQVTPRISPDGNVLMRVDPTISSLAPNGVPIGTSAGSVITAPIINTTRAQTTISAADGHTVVIGGLLSRSEQVEVRQVPWLGDIPILGWAFKTEFKTLTKRELLIILTPHIIYNEWDAQRLKEIEASRINWILCNVEKMQGPIDVPDGKPTYYAHGVPYRKPEVDTGGWSYPKDERVIANCKPCPPKDPSYPEGTADENAVPPGGTIDGMVPVPQDPPADATDKTVPRPPSRGSDRRDGKAPPANFVPTPTPPAPGLDGTPNSQTPSAKEPPKTVVSKKPAAAQPGNEGLCEKLITSIRGKPLEPVAPTAKRERDKPLGALTIPDNPDAVEIPDAAKPEKKLLATIIESKAPPGPPPLPAEPPVVRVELDKLTLQDVPTSDKAESAKSTTAKKKKTSWTKGRTK